MACIVSGAAYRDPVALAAEIARQSDRITLVSVDGVDGSGKTHFATTLAQLLGSEHLELDSFLDRQKGGYLQFLRYAALQERLEQIHRAGRNVVIDGVCILQVLEHVRSAPTLRVYVKRVSSDGDWFDGRNFVRERTADELIREEERGTRLIAERLGHPVTQEVLPALVKEIIQYHFKYWPHESADYTYERIAG